MTYLLDKTRRSFLHPEIQAELEFGIEQSANVDEDVFLEYLSHFIEQSDDWVEADGEIVNIRHHKQQRDLPCTDDLKAAVKHEVAYQYAIWGSDYLKALECARAVLASLTAPELRGYRALWFYLAGSAAYRASVSKTAALGHEAHDYYRRAKSAAPEVGWLAKLSHNETAVVSTKHDISLQSVIERLEARLTELGTVHDKKFADEERFIIENIQMAEARPFEAAHERVGRLLGYQAGNQESTGAPDPWWIADDSLCFIFEDHSNASSSSLLDVTKARQVSSHPNWVRANIQLDHDADVVPVLISPVAKADSDALPHLKNVSFWPIDEFRDWVLNSLRVVRDLRREFPGAGDLAWRAQAMELYRQHQIDPEGLRAFLVARCAQSELS